MNKQTALEASTIDTDEAREELAYNGMVYTHTHYGRGFAPSNAEQIGNTLRAFQIAKAAAGDAPVVFVIDEDALFAPTGDWTPSDDSDWTADERKKFLEEYRAGEVWTEEQALLVWWDAYGRYGSQEDNPGLREDLAEVAGVHPEVLEDYED